MLGHNACNPPVHFLAICYHRLAVGWGDDFFKSEWKLTGQIDGNGSTLTLDAGNRIAIEASSTAFPPTNQFAFQVSARPLDVNGQIMPSMASPGWFEPVGYSSGFTGGSLANTFVIEAIPYSPAQRWTISIPLQSAAHGNAANNTLRIYVPR